MTRELRSTRYLPRISIALYCNARGSVSRGAWVARDDAHKFSLLLAKLRDDYHRNANAAILSDNPAKDPFDQREYTEAQT